MNHRVRRPLLAFLLPLSLVLPTQSMAEARTDLCVNTKLDISMNVQEDEEGMNFLTELTVYNEAGYTSRLQLAYQNDGMDLKHPEYAVLDSSGSPVAKLYASFKWIDNHSLHVPDRIRLTNEGASGTIMGTRLNDSMLLIDLNESTQEFICNQ